MYSCGNSETRVSQVVCSDNGQHWLNTAQVKVQQTDIGLEPLQHNNKEVQKLFLLILNAPG